MAKKTITTEAGNASNGRVRLDTSTSKPVLELRRPGVQSMPLRIESAQPIMMMSTADMQGAPWRGNHRRRGANGIERLPSVCHVMDDKFVSREVHPRAEIGRWRTVLNAVGNEISQVLSNGSAHLVDVLDGKFSHDMYCQYALGKAHALGWIPAPAEAGCTKRLIAEGRVNPARLIKRDEIEKLPTCKAGATTCRHYELERDARRARQVAKEREQAEALKPNEARTLDKLTEIVAVLARRESK